MCAAKANPEFRKGKLCGIVSRILFVDWETAFYTCVNVNQMCEIFQNYLNVLIQKWVSQCPIHTTYFSWSFKTNPTYETVEMSF